MEKEHHGLGDNTNTNQNDAYTSLRKPKEVKVMSEGYGKMFTSTTVILVLYILLVIVLKTF